MNNLTGQFASDTYGRLVQVIDGNYYDGFGNPLSIGNGVIGETGPEGPQGPAGPQGPVGQSITLLGSYTDYNEFLLGAGGSTGTNIGDSWVMLDTGDLYTWNGSSWFNAGSLKGPEGSFNGDIATFSSITATNSSFTNLNLQTTTQPLLSNNGDIYYDGTHSYLYSGTWSQIITKSSNIISVQKNGGDFTSLKEAVDSITDSSSTNGYVINVGPGEFYEDTIDFTGKTFISVVGSDIQITKIIANTSAQDLFVVVNSVELSFMTLKGVGAGYAAISCDDIDGFSLIHKLSFYDCDTNVLVRSSSNNTSLFIEYVDFNGDYSYGIKVESNNGYTALVNAENYYNFPGVTGSISNYASGVGSIINILGSGNTGFGNDKAFYIEDGANLTINSCNITGYEKGIEVGNVGVASTFDINATSIVYCTFNMYIKHPYTFGTFQGSNSHSKIVNDSSSVYWGFLDNEDGEFDVTRKISVTNADGTHVDLSTLIFEGSAMGVLDGGDISTYSGLTISISTGYGYLESSTSGNVLRVDWETTLLSVTNNSANYIYRNENGFFQSNTLPDIEKNIVFGRVVTQGGSIILIDDSKIDVKHVADDLKLFNRQALGSIYDSGSIVTSAAYSLNVTSGSYYFGSKHYLPVGGTGITFSQYVRNGSSWTITNTNLVTSQYDNNSGLTGMSASYFTKHTLYVSGEGVNQKYLLVVGQTQYNNILSVEGAALPIPPTYFIDSITPIASIVVRQGTSAIYEVLDIRPVIGFKSSGVNSSSLHSNLIGLSADDHTQYLLVSGSRAMAGNLIMASNSITGVSQVNGVTIESHSSRHLPNGSDPLITGIPESIGTTNQEGIQNAFARQDHVHSHGDQLGGTLHATASSTTAGFMSSTDKVILDSIPTTFNSKLDSASPSYTGLMSGVGTTQTGTSSTGVLNLTQTWNTTGTPTAIKLNVTNTAAGGNPFLMDLQTGGVSQFRVSAIGSVAALGSSVASAFGATIGPFQSSGIHTPFAYSQVLTLTSGNAVINGFQFSPTINQTGVANGITRGLYINPTLTSAFDFRAIETTNGKVIFTDTFSSGTGSLAGSLLSLNQTWNTTGTPTAIKLNVTDTTSNTNSLLIDLQLTGSSRFSVNKSGGLSATTFNSNITPNVNNILTIGTSTNQYASIFSNVFSSNGTGILRSGTNLIFQVLGGTVEAARFFNNGNLSIGTQSDNGSKLQINGNITSTTYNSYIPLPTTAATTTGVTISFITDRVYGTLVTPETGNITANVTGGQLGVTNIIIHNSGTVPTFGSEFKKLSGSGNYLVSNINYIYCTYITSTEIIYSINQRT